MSYEHDGIAGLDLRSICMEPGETDETETKRSATYNFDSCWEPNSMWHAPKEDFECLFDEFNDRFKMPHGEMNPDWKFKVAQCGNFLMTAFHSSMKCLNVQN